MSLSQEQRDRSPNPQASIEACVDHAMSLAREIDNLEAEIAKLRAALAEDESLIDYRSYLDEQCALWCPILIKMWERWEKEHTIPPLPTDLIEAIQRSHQNKIILVFFIWLAAAGLPIIATKFPAKEHTLFEDWLATFSLAVALTAVVMARKKHAIDA